MAPFCMSKCCRKTRVEKEAWRVRADVDVDHNKHRHFLLVDDGDGHHCGYLSMMIMVIIVVVLFVAAAVVCYHLLLLLYLKTCFLF